MRVAWRAVVELPRVYAMCGIEGGKLAVAAKCNDVGVIDPAAPLPTGVHWLRGHTDQVRTVQPFGSDRLVSCSKDGSVRVWTAQSEAHTQASDACVGVLRPPSGCHVNHVAGLADGGSIAAAGSDRQVYVWDAVTGELRHSFSAGPAGVFSMAPLLDGQLACGGGDGVVRLFDVTSGRVTAALAAGKSFVHHCVTTPDGDIVTSDNRFLRLWDGGARLRLHERFLQAQTGAWGVASFVAGPGPAFVAVASKAYDDNVEVMTSQLKYACELPETAGHTVVATTAAGNLVTAGPLAPHRGQAAGDPDAPRPHEVCVWARAW